MNFFFRKLKKYYYAYNNNQIHYNILQYIIININVQAK